MGIEVFNRFEKKYLIRNEQYEELVNRLNEYMELDPYNQANGFYTICNIYYDTKNHDLIKRSLAKPEYKEKLRLRAYGVPESGTKGYMEIKKKYKGIVNKRRTNITLQEAYDYMETQKKPKIQAYHNQQVLAEIDYFMKRYELKPMVYIAYDRKAMCKGNLRITFDTNIRTRRYDLALELGDYGTSLLEDGMWLMEIKIDQAFPLWLSGILSEMEIYSKSYSKYGAEFINFIGHPQRKGAIEPCLNQYSQVKPQVIQYL